MTLDLQKEGTIIGPGKFLEWVHIKSTGAVANRAHSPLSSLSYQLGPS